MLLEFIAFGFLSTQLTTTLKKAFRKSHIFNFKSAKWTAKTLTSEKRLCENHFMESRSRAFRFGILGALATSKRWISSLKRVSKSLDHWFYRSKGVVKTWYRYSWAAEFQDFKDCCMLSYDSVSTQTILFKCLSDSEYRVCKCQGVEWRVWRGESRPARCKLTSPTSPAAALMSHNPQREVPLFIPFRFFRYIFCETELWKTHGTRNRR